MPVHHTNAHAGNGEQILGVTRDPVLRPAGTLIAIVGTIWALFWGMAADAGSYGQPLAAAALIAVGVLAVAVGKPEEQI